MQGMSESIDLHQSDLVGNLNEDVIRLKSQYARLWWQSGPEFPRLGRTFTKTEQKQTEKKLSAFIDEASERLTTLPVIEGEQEEWLDDFVHFLKKFGREVLDLSDVYLDGVLRQSYVDSTRGFIDAINAFDPEMNIEYVYQALRNVWIMNTLQAYLGIDIEYSDAIFAYSLLYPLTDNFIDDTDKSEERKYTLVERLKAWLEGGFQRPGSEREKKILRLIALIENQYDRQTFPKVFQSLLAIFNAQIKSLNQQKKFSLPYELDLIDVSMEKGGTSVLADGYLVAGNLEEEEADFCFGFGAFLQLCDDIQDTSEDKSNHHMTLFSQTAGRFPLDRLANKLFSFISNVVDLKLDENNPDHRTLKTVIKGNCCYLVLEAIGKQQSFFSNSYLQDIQHHFPVRFSYLKSLRKKLKKKFMEGKNKSVYDLNFISTVVMTAVSRTVSGL